MRRITLKMPRRQLADTYVFCIDPDGDETVNGHLCRRLCSLGGGERTFDLSNETSGFFAVVEQNYQKKVVGELFFEPDWRDLSFSFRSARVGDGVLICEVKEREGRVSGRTKAMIIKWTMIALFALFTFGGIIGIILRPYSKIPKKFEVGELKITLTDAFERDYYAPDDAYAAFFTETCYVMVEKLPFSEFHDFKYYFEVEFCELIKESNGYYSQKVEQKGALTYFVYHMSDNGENFKNYLYVYKTEDAFWVVQIISETEYVKYWEGSYHKWAESVRFE
ncbi:MAG: hypothetical protein IJ345_01640 [Clostridia bacterium]|nr:hypothetical protein [Clostridia bacterium]